MGDSAVKRLSLLALVLLLLGVSLLSFWAWKAMEVNLRAEGERIKKFEELAAFQVVDNLGSELFHLYYTFSVGVARVASVPMQSWGRSLESVVANYKTQTRYPGLLADVLLVVDPPVGPRRWVRWSADGWIEGTRPSWIDPTTTLFDLGTDASLDLETPYLVFHLPSRPSLRQALVVRYSVDVVVGQVVPDLIRGAFAEEPRASQYQVDVKYLEAGLGASALAWDVSVPLIPRVRFSQWLSAYPDRTPLPVPVAPDYYDLRSRWTLRIKFRPDGVAQFIERRRVENWFWVGSLALVVSSGFGLALVSLRGLLRTSEKERAFASLVSHELKTPLAAIRSLAENLGDGVVSTPSRVQDYGKAILDQSGRLNELVSNILALAVLDLPGGRLAIDTFDLSELARSVAAEAGLRVGQGPGPWGVKGHRAAVRAALDNLVTNALRYGVREGSQPHVALGLHRSRRWGRPWVGVSVTDHGRGVSRLQAKLLLRRRPAHRSSADQRIQASGVGLSLVKTTLRHLGGRVQVRLVPGGGLTFILWLRPGEVTVDVAGMQSGGNS